MSDDELERALLPPPHVGAAASDDGAGSADDEEAALSEAPSLQRTLTRWDGISLTVGLIIGARSGAARGARTGRELPTGGAARALVAARRQVAAARSGGGSPPGGGSARAGGAHGGALVPWRARRRADARRRARSLGALGSGVFTSPGVVLREAGSASAGLACWVAAAGIAALSALCYAELSTSLPNAVRAHHARPKKRAPRTRLCCLDQPRGARSNRASLRAPSRTHAHTLRAVTMST
jgi:hypothetical protein